MSNTAAVRAFEKLTALAQQYPQVWEGWGPVSEEIVIAAETRLGLPFPKSYRMFLLRYGFANLRGSYINGVFPNSTVDNLRGALFFETERAWQEKWIPRDCLYIENRDESDILIDTSQMQDGEAPVIEVPRGTPPEKVDRTPISPSFAEYYLRWLEGVITYLKQQGKLNA